MLVTVGNFEMLVTDFVVNEMNQLPIINVEMGCTVY